MATVSGLGTTYNLPNYAGDLFQVSPSDTPFLSAIGGLSGGRRTTSTKFQWQTEGIESTSANNAVIEGADAPTASEVARSNVFNVCEIHQEAVKVSYTKQAATGLLNGINTADGANPVNDELAHQIQLKLKKIAVDVEKSFLSGVLVDPANNSTARHTAGLDSVITTNVSSASSPRALSTDIVNSLLSGMYSNGSPLNQDNTVFLVGPKQKLALTKVYSASGLNQPTPTRNVGGVAIDTLVTDFGTFGVMLDRWVPADTIYVVDLSVCAPVFLEIPGKGTLFAEPLAKTGASENYQLYGEVGLYYGPESFHGTISDLS